MSSHNDMISRSLLDQAVQVLGAVLSFRHPADGVLSRHFRAQPKMGHRDRAFVAENVYGVLRRLRWLRRLAGYQAAPRQLLLAWLVRGEGLSVRQIEAALTPPERQFVANIRAREITGESLGERCDLPDWLVEALLPVHGEDGLLALAHALNRPAPLDLRVNTLKCSREEALSALAHAGIAAVEGRLSPLAIRVEGKPPVNRLALFADGKVEIQDEGSQLLSFLLAPRRGEKVVDFCAGAGGKTLQLGALMRNTGRLYAFDVAERRLAKLKPRMARSGLSNVHPVLIAGENDNRVKRLAGKVDRVLVDAPCSGLGTLRRNPDLKWRQSAEAVGELAAKQAAILRAAARLLKPGGRLVYATCSLLAAENEAIVDAFLAETPDFAVRPAGEVLDAQGIELRCGERLALLPNVHDTDGFFAAVLERRGP